VLVSKHENRVIRLKLGFVVVPSRSGEPPVTRHSSEYLPGVRVKL
jgi:hypothetical protein